MRQTSGAMICPQCGKLISVSEEKCPFCGAWRPGMFGYAPVVKRVIGRVDFAKLVTVGCVALYLVALALQPDAIFQSFGFFSFLSPGSRALYQLGMTGGPAWRYHWWWTLLTAIYLHGGLLHIFFNLMWVRNLGPSVEDVFGTARAFVIFSVAGAAGFLVSNVATGHPSIGASGSIFGLLGALIVFGHRHGGAEMRRELWGYAVMMFIFGFFMSAVNNWAHLGGFAGGWVTGRLLKFQFERRESVTEILFALALLGLTVAGFVFSFFNVTSLLLR